MPKKSKPLFKGKKKQLVTGLVVVVLLILATAIGVGLRWWQNKQAAQNGNGSTNLNLGESGLPADTLPQKVKEAQDLASSGKVDDSNKAIDSALGGTSNSDEKYDLYLQQGVNNENQQKYDAAVASYKSAEASKQTFTVYKSLGRVSEALNKKQDAIDYYKKALTLIGSKDPLRDFEKKDLEQT